MEPRALSLDGLYGWLLRRLQLLSHFVQRLTDLIEALLAWF